MNIQTARDFERWLDRYGRAWMTGDPGVVLELFTSDAVYHETPFDAPMIGVDAIFRYWTEGAKNTQTDVRFEATCISFTGDTGFARWWASFHRVPSKAFVELDGVLSARFDERMRCAEFREWWHRREGTGR